MDSMLSGLESLEVTLPLITRYLDHSIPMLTAFGQNSRTEVAKVKGARSRFYGPLG